jgi:hypothetical protein
MIIQNKVVLIHDIDICSFNLRNCLINWVWKVFFWYQNFRFDVFHVIKNRFFLCRMFMNFKKLVIFYAKLIFLGRIRTFWWAIFIFSVVRVQIPYLLFLLSFLNLFILFISFILFILIDLKLTMSMDLVVCLEITLQFINI